MGRKRTFTPEVVEMYAEKLKSFTHLKLSQKSPLILAGFLAENGLNRETVSNWSDSKSPYYSDVFSDAIKAFKNTQEADFVDGISTGRYNASSGIFILKNVAGYRDEKHIRASVEQLISFGVPKNELPEGNRLAEYSLDELSG